LEDSSSQNELEDKDLFYMPKETINTKNVNELFKDTLPMTQSHELAVLFDFIKNFNIK
jgi:hypothetical protein